MVWRDIARGGRWLRAVLLITGMVVVPLVSLVHVQDDVPGAPTRGAGARAGDVRLVALERSAAPVAASRSRLALLPREDTMEPTTTTVTTAPPPPTTLARPKPKPAAVAPKPAPAVTAKPAPAPAPAPPAPAHVEEGAASFYNAPKAEECAHRTAPFGTVMTVTNITNGKSTTCRVGDRGPFVAGRVIDLSRQGFAAIAPTSSGVVRVRVSW